MNKRIFRLFSIFVITLFLFTCNNDQDVSLDEVGNFISALPETISYPADNPYSEEKEELGRLLFWDPILSGNKDVACASCHHPELGYADGIKFSQGVNGEGLGTNRSNGMKTERNSPTVINTVFNGIDNDGYFNSSTAPMFWDNRAKGLEEQALLPLLSKEEMRGENYTEDEIVNVILQRLNEIPEYQDKFNIAFGSSEITEENLLKAIATFERGIVANNSRFDQYMRGDENAITDFELRGMREFIEVGCADCHSGPMFSDYELHVLGVPDNRNNQDEGSTGIFDFRTPTLRNLKFTAPYMHNGLFDDLEDVVDFYHEISLIFGG